MTISKPQSIRAFVTGFILCFSLGINADNLTTQATTSAQKWFNQASTLIKQNKLVPAIKLLKQAASRGHGRAAFELASMYEVGLGVEQDFHQAKKYYEVSVKQGYRDAYFNLALFLSNPMTPNNDLKRAREVVSVIANEGDVEAQFFLATLMRSKMQNISTEPGKAFYWLQHAANSGHGKAQSQLGTQYLKGEHVSRSTQTALKWLKRAAIQNIPEAHFNLALMYEKGDGLPKSKSKSIDWYKSAASLGSPDAQQNLAIKYLKGDSVKQMPKTTIELLTSAATSGSESSQMLLGKLYQTGYKDIIRKDLAKAEKWYLKAARQGKTEAQYQLALMLLDKESGADEAKFWIRRAAAAGHVKASQLQANL